MNHTAPLSWGPFSGLLRERNQCFEGEGERSEAAAKGGGVSVATLTHPLGLEGRRS